MPSAATLSTTSPTDNDSLHASWSTFVRRLVLWQRLLIFFFRPPAVRTVGLHHTAHPTDPRDKGPHRASKPRQMQEGSAHYQRRSWGYRGPRGPGGRCQPWQGALTLCV